MGERAALITCPGRGREGGRLGWQVSQSCTSAASPTAAAVAQCTLDRTRGHSPGLCHLSATTPALAPELPAEVLGASEEDSDQELGAAGAVGELGLAGVEEKSLCVCVWGGGHRRANGKGAGSGERARAMFA